jgi:hypothetical protein
MICTYTSTQFMKNQLFKQMECKNNMDTIVPLPFQHKLLLFCLFKNLKDYFIYVKILINKEFHCQGLNPRHPLSRSKPPTSKDKVLTLKWSRHTKLFHNTAYILIIIIYNHYMLKFSKSKNQV